MRMKKIFIILFLPFISFSQLIEIPVDTMIHSYHETTIKGEKVKYIAEVGTQPVWDENGEPMKKRIINYEYQREKQNP